MADDKEKDEELKLENPGKKKKLIIIIAAVVLIAAVGGGAFFFMAGDKPVAPSKGDASAESGDKSAAVVVADDQSASVGSALYVPMPRAFRFNVQGTARDRFVEIRVQLLVRSSDNEEIAKKNIPLIESTLLAVFSQSNADDLSTSAGKESLKQKSLAAVQQAMMEISKSKVVEKVLFTGFIMQ